MKLLERLNSLKEAGLISDKYYPEMCLHVFKYARNVFFKNLWNTDSLLKEARGLVMNDNGEIVVYPFTKTFNYLENGTTVDPEMYVIAPRKMNGFMATLSVSEEYGVLVSTTGTLDSDYAKLAKEKILKKVRNLNMMKSDCTYIFEICDPSDPHIIDEEPGVYLIGARLNKLNSELASENELDRLAEIFRFKRPEWSTLKFKDLLEKVKHARHEGFMIRDANNGKTLCKIKTPYYLAKKGLQRCGARMIGLMWNNSENYKQRLDEEFYSLFDFIIATYTKEQWLAFTETERSDIIKEFFHDDLSD